MFACKRCRQQVVVCSSCERGQEYCSKVCSEASRAENCRVSGARYRQTKRGRESGRTRQRRYRQNDADRKREEARRGAAMLDGEGEFPLSASQVEVAVAPCMRFSGAAQSLSGSRMSALPGVVDDQDGGFVAALDLAQEGEDGRDFADCVLVDAVQADEGGEHEQPLTNSLDGRFEAEPVGADVEADALGVDDGDVEAVEVDLCGFGGAGDALTQEMVCILCGEQQHWTRFGNRDSPDWTIVHASAERSLALHSSP